MRFFQMGLIHLLLVSTALAGVIGRVDSIGFEAQIRPDCWTPMLVQITSDAAGPEEYTLQIVQLDMDGDEVIYTTPKKTVNPGTQNFWLYFKPQSVAGGLPSAGNGTAQELARKLRVYVASADGRKRLVQISVAGRMPEILDDLGDRPADKLIVCVGRRPNTIEFDKSSARGLSETIKFSATDTRRLPDQVIGYESVDAVVWTDADPDRLEPAQFRALRQWVRGGGRLVILQNPEPGRTEKFNDFLPVRVRKIESLTGLEPLKSILHPRDRKPPVDPDTLQPRDPFSAVHPPFRVARAEALSDSVVETWMTWPDGAVEPYLARRLYGMGMVAWVAQDITDPSIRDVAWGWPNFWARVFGWPVQSPSRGLDLTEIATSAERDNLKTTWTATGSRDIGPAFIDKLDLESKTAALISLAFLFFVGYWIIAGPGVYLVLAAKKRTQMSWFIFGAIAVLATLLTVGVTQLVLRGQAELRHVSLVRLRGDGGDAARVFSRLGVYLPQDRSDTAVTLSGHELNGATLITPLSVAPRYAPRSEVNPRDSRYEIVLSNEDVDPQVTTRIPFRSTLKKLQLDWTGAPSGRLSGTPRLLERGNAPIAGNLSNNTGRDLRNVTMVFNLPLGETTRDCVLYTRLWQNGATIELDKIWEKAETRQALDRDLVRSGSLDFILEGQIYMGLRSRLSLGNAAQFNDSDGGYRQSFLIASLFERLPPMRNIAGENSDRVDLFRRGVRNWDVSGAVASGALVVLAQSGNDTIPYPLTVEGDVPEGAGMTFWQFIIPVDRSQVNQPPSTQPDTN